MEKTDKDIYINQLQAKLDSKIKENRVLSEKIKALESDQQKQADLVQGLVAEKIDTANLPRVAESEIRERVMQLEVENTRLKVCSTNRNIITLSEYPCYWRPRRRAGGIG